MNKYFTALMFFSGMTVVVSAQTSSTNEKQSAYITKDTLQGTYEIIQNDNKLTPVFTTDILNDIEKARDDHEIKYITIGPNTTVKIFPRSMVNSNPSSKQKK